MLRNIQRSGLLGGLIIFAILWTLLMGLGVSGGSPSRDRAADSPAATFGAGAHIMYVDDSRFPTITVYLAVNDAQGQVLPGLQKEDFAIREDGADVDITDFIGAGGGASSTLLVIDQSGSMRDEGKMAGAVRAAQTYINLLKPGSDKLGVIVFSDSSLTLAPLDEVTDQNRTILNNVLGGLFPLSGTQFYAATREAVQAISQVDGRKVVLALTDGMDASGQAGLPQTVAQAQTAKTPIYVVGLGSDVDREGLARLASETGGQAYFSPGAAELEALYRGIASGLRNEYALTYQSLTPNLDGTQRSLDVTIATGQEKLQTDGGYAVGGILASGLNLALFIPTLMVLFVGLAGLYYAPNLRRSDKQKGEAAHATEDRPARTAEQEQNQMSSPIEVKMAIEPPSPSIQIAAPVSLIIVHRLATETLVGSAAGSTLLLPSASIAPQQARIYLNAGRYAIDDLTGKGSTQVSFGGDPALLRSVQRNALREGSLVQLGSLHFIFRQALEAASLEQRLPLPSGGFSIGTDQICDVVIAAESAQRVCITSQSKYWLVERQAGECQVSYNGSLEQLRPVTDRNALKPGSCLTVGGVLLRLEPA